MGGGQASKKANSEDTQCSTRGTSVGAPDTRQTALHSATGGRLRAPPTTPPGSAKKKKTGRTQAGKNEKGAFRCLLNPALVRDKKRSISKPISTLRMPHIPPPVFFFSIKVTSLFPPVSSQAFFFFWRENSFPLCSRKCHIPANL